MFSFFKSSASSSLILLFISSSIPNNSSKYKISCGAGLNSSLLTDFFRIRTLYFRIDTLYLVCEGMGITLEEFFKDSMFNIENIEIKDSKD